MSVLGKLDTRNAVPLDRSIMDRLSAGIAPKMLPVFEDINHEICETLDQQRITAEARVHAEEVSNYCLKQSERIAQFKDAERQFQTRLTHAVDESERRAAIIEFALALGADRQKLRSDQRALDAWFDADAVIERYHKRVGERERALAHALDRLGVIAAEAIETDPMMVETAFFVDVSDRLLAQMRSWPGDARVRRAAHLCLAQIASRVHHWPFGIWFETVLSATRRVCFDENEDVWVQCAAFDALLALSPGSIAGAFKARLKQPVYEKSPLNADNERFLRRHLIRIIGQNIALDESFPKLIVQLAKDQSGVVRQAITDILPFLPKTLAAHLCTALRDDTDPQVRASVFADVPKMLNVITPPAFAAHIASILAEDDNEFVQRIALDAASNLAAQCLLGLQDNGPLIDGLLGTVADFRDRNLSAKVMRWADEAYEQIWLASDQEALEIAKHLRAVIHDQREADIRRVPALADILAGHPEKVGRVAAVLAQRDFGLSIKRGRHPSVQRGEWFKRRLWRVLFEGRQAATDKRQAHIHTTGRHYHGTLIAPSARMAELAPTKVPGEPLVEAAEGGWRNYLPLLDLVLSSLDHGQDIQIFTSAGITKLSPPRGFWRRARVFTAVTRRFSELANLRNREPAEFLSVLRGFGVELTFDAYPGVMAANNQVVQYFQEGEVVC